MKDYTPGDAYANLKDEMASEFTIGRPMEEGTTTYKSGATRTITNTPYGQHVEMRGPNASKAGASGPPKGFVPKPLTDDEIIDRTGVVQMRNVEDLVRAYVSGKLPPPMRTGDEIERDFILDSMVREKVNPFVFPQATPDN